MDLATIWLDETDVPSESNISFQLQVARHGCDRPESITHHNKRRKLWVDSLQSPTIPLRSIRPPYQGSSRVQPSQSTPLQPVPTFPPDQGSSRVQPFQSTPLQPVPTFPPDQSSSRVQPFQSTSLQSKKARPGGLQSKKARPGGLQFGAQELGLLVQKPSFLARRRRREATFAQKYKEEKANNPSEAKKQRDYRKLVEKEKASFDSEIEVSCHTFIQL